MSATYDNFVITIEDTGAVSIVWHLPDPDNVKKFGWRTIREPKATVVSLSKDAADEQAANIACLLELAHHRRRCNTATVHYVRRTGNMGLSKRCVASIAGYPGCPTGLERIPQFSMVGPMK